MSITERVLYAAVYAAIPYYDHENDVPPAVTAYVAWIYGHPIEMWADLTGT